jgi:hypothetical protein
MASIMADHNVEGHFVVLLRLWTSDVWRTVWESLELEVESFERLGPPLSTWSSLCQELRSRDVLAVLIRGALRWCLLGPTRMFLISREVH